jgi:hypothetical protein
LRKAAGFPKDLAPAVRGGVRDGGVRLHLPAERVRVFERVVGEELREWRP